MTDHNQEALSAEALKACPFCGEEGAVKGVRDGLIGYCTSCHAESQPAFSGKFGWDETRARAIAAWNRRAPTPATGAERERVARIVDPEQWRIHDEYMASHAAHLRGETPAPYWEKVAKEGVAKSLAKADAIMSTTSPAAGQELRGAAQAIVDCWGVGSLNITAMSGFVDELRAALASPPAPSEGVLGDTQARIDGLGRLREGAESESWDREAWLRYALDRIKTVAIGNPGCNVAGRLEHVGNIASKALADSPPPGTYAGDALRISTNPSPPLVVGAEP